MSSWSPFEDLPDDFQSLASPELELLARIWEEQRGDLEQRGSLAEFSGRLRREWAIETGILERIYELDRGVTEVLIEQGIDPSLIPDEATDQDPRQVATMIRDHEAAIEGLFAFVKGDRRLSVGYVKELHSVLTRNQESSTAIDQFGRAFEASLVRGAFKKLPNNPRRPGGGIHEYCPPEQVDSEMDRLVQLHAKHRERRVAPEVEAAWLHHRFTQIHPFQDGNGRVARCLASLVTIRAGLFPVVVRRDDRLLYIRSLESADHGDLRPLVGLFVSLEKRALVGALGIAREVEKVGRVSQVIDALRGDLDERRERTRREWVRAKETASRLQQEAVSRLQSVRVELEDKVSSHLTNAKFSVSEALHGTAQDYYFRYQVVATAKTLGYFADLAEYRSWVRLVLRTNSQSEILISFHGLGRVFRGLLAVSACFFRRDDSAEDTKNIADLMPLSEELFQVNYVEDLDTARERFSVWIEAVLVKGLDLWRHTQ
ncbi:MAG: Fic family protein [Planctomycetota bacterium]